MSRSAHVGKNGLRKVRKQELLCHITQTWRAKPLTSRDGITDLRP